MGREAAGRRIGAVENVVKQCREIRLTGGNCPAERVAACVGWSRAWSGNMAGCGKYRGWREKLVVAWCSWCGLGNVEGIGDGAGRKEDGGRGR